MDPVKGGRPKWTRTKGDCRSFVTEYAADAFYHISPKYLLLTKRKKVGGEISYKIDLPYVEFTWVSRGFLTFVSEYVLRFEDRDTMREVYYRYRKFSNGELFSEELEKEDGTIINRYKHEGKWGKAFTYRKGLETHYRCK